MTYISMQEDHQETQEMTKDEVRRGLMEISLNNSGILQRDELFKLLTSSGQKFTPKEANLAISLLPKKDGAIEVSALVEALFCESQKE
ncbi:hypothetical protein NEFER03_0794 [Nematocida sp. LUAm3]|nr:hypothetical protein NEFER03_0794 [Nematocida sp. LUAm3]KAI5174819.1 hypothetical protein NEFER02_0919 [Nematocida sp. LUAm2]KAI5177426.1 hypothetical protein NEFER01_0676 [Nematocida sp. LUAm1]